MAHLRHLFFLTKKQEIQDLAEQVIRSQTTLTGVQPKISLGFDCMSRAQKRFTIVGLWEHFSHFLDV